ncbi:hypothetical protein FOZ62_016794, partial [Perkinsus olseni]
RPGASLLPPVVAPKNSGTPANGVASEPYDGEYTVTYGAPSFLGMNATVNSDKKAIRIAFVCEHELHGFDQELDYKVRGAGSEATLDIWHASGYYGLLLLAFAQLCPKFGNGQP